MRGQRVPKTNRVLRGGAAAVRPASHYAALTPQRKRLVNEYLKDLNAWQAGLRAGYSPTSVYQVLREETVQLALRERREQIDGERALEGARYVLNKLWDIGSADPRELVEIWKVPCRYCWGVGGQYQFTRAEMLRLLKAHKLGCDDKPLEALWPRGPAEAAAWQAGKNAIPLDTQGGDGYTAKRDPNPNCSECAGDGVMLQHIHDTRHLSPQAQALYRGVKVNNGKFELVLADQAAAREQLARHYGVVVERKKILVRHLDPNELSDEELVQSLSELEALANSSGTYEVPEPAPKRPVLTRPVT
jgi:phage terminase small subunit